MAWKGEVMRQLKAARERVILAQGVEVGEGEDGTEVDGY
jgi:hypothetical protein